MYVHALRAIAVHLGLFTGTDLFKRPSGSKAMKRPSGSTTIKRPSGSSDITKKKAYSNTISIHSRVVSLLCSLYVCALSACDVMRSYACSDSETLHIPSTTSLNSNDCWTTVWMWMQQRNGRANSQRGNWLRSSATKASRMCHAPFRLPYPHPSHTHLFT